MISIMDSVSVLTTFTVGQEVDRLPDAPPAHESRFLQRFIN